jgi:hypothetical protein
MYAQMYEGSDDLISHTVVWREDQRRVVTANGGGEDRSVWKHGLVAQFTALRNEAWYGRYTKDATL